MISIGKVRDAAYYLTEVTSDDSAGYYLDDASPSRWLGRLGEEHGLRGRVDADAFRRILNGQRPDGGPLTEHATSTRAIDVTLSVPKSVSLLWALGDSATQRKVLESLDATQAAVIEFLELEATKVRRGHGGVDVQQGSGLLVAAFDHRTSRLGDPNLHRHLVIANATIGPDGRTTALDTRQLYRIRYTTEAVFQAVLRHELTTRLGVRFEASDRHGAAEIEGVPSKVIRAFSRRRREIENEMLWHNTTTGHGARIAALATRTPKREMPSDDVLEHRWRSTAHEHGFDVALIPRVERIQMTHVGDDELAADVTAHDATYTRWDALRATCRLSVSGATLHQLLARTDAYLASSQAVPLARERFTTPEILELERRTVAGAVAGRAAGIGVADPASIRDALARRPRLAAEQQRLVSSVAASGDAVSVVIGQAGAGKTTAIDALRDAYRSSGFRVIGAALSARAAAELQAGAGMPAHTLHWIESKLRYTPRALNERTVLVVDEAAMVGTRQLAAILDAARTARTKVVLVGDTGQLPEIEAGGTFAAIARRVDPVHLVENRRQEHPEHRAALTALRHADIDRALAHLDRALNLSTGPDADTVRTALVADWQRAVAEGLHAVMLAANRSDVADLNRRAVDHLALGGRLGPVVWRSDELTLHAGDLVVAHRNRHDLGLLNGHRGSVVDANDHGVLVQTEQGERVRVPDAYIEAGHLTHGYALTVYKAQGMTCDAAYFLGDDGLFRELAYTGLSRGRRVNHFYAVAARDEWGAPAVDPFAVVRRSLGVSRAKTAAIDLDHDIPDLP